MEHPLEDRVIAGWLVLIGAVPTDAIQWAAIGEKIAGSLLYLIVWVVLAGALAFQRVSVRAVP